MKTIYKYELSDFNCVYGISMPKFAEVLHVGMINSMPHVWVMVDTDNKPEKRNFKKIGTGDVIDKILDLTYLGACFEDIYVWHIFEVGE